MSMKNCEEIKKDVESILNELKVIYTYVDFEDDDINYLINFNTYGRLKSLNSIGGILYFCHSNFSMNFLVLNIYSYKGDDIRVYEAINEVNSQLLYGSFLIDDDDTEEKRILYRSSINCGRDYCGLDKSVLKQQLDVFATGLEKLFDLLKSRE